MIVVFLRGHEKFQIMKSIHTVAGQRIVRMEHVTLTEEFLRRHGAKHFPVSGYHLIMVLVSSDHKCSY